MAKSKDKNSRGPILSRLLGGRPWGRYLALVAALVWMFVLGLFVGRGTAPVRFDLDALTRELSERKAADIRRQEQRVKKDAEAAGQKTDLEFYEELKKSSPTPRPSGEKTRPEKPVAAKRKITKPAVKKPQKQPAAPSAPAPATRPPAAGSSAKLTIQAASLRDLEDADALVRRLKDKGYPAFKTIAKIPERGIWFRVRVGSFASKDEAGAVMKKLAAEGFKPLLVRQD